MVVKRLVVGVRELMVEVTVVMVVSITVMLAQQMLRLPGVIFLLLLSRMSRMSHMSRMCAFQHI